MSLSHLNDGYVFCASVCLKTHWLFTASVKSRGWMGRVYESCAPPCCSSWMLGPAGHRDTRSWAAKPPPDPLMLKVSTEWLSLKELLSDYLICSVWVFYIDCLNLWFILVCLSNVAWNVLTLCFPLYVCSIWVELLLVHLSVINFSKAFYNMTI